MDVNPCHGANVLTLNLSTLKNRSMFVTKHVKNKQIHS